MRDTQGFFVAGRGVPAAANGMAIASDWMSAASFISMAGIISILGYAGSIYLMGWTGGYVLLALLIAPYLRKFGHYTVPDFVGDRYESNLARIVAVVCAIFISFTYVAGQMRGVGVVFSRFLEVDITVGVMIGMAIVFVYATLGGMKGITWTQVAQYWVLITAFLIPAIAISIKLTGIPVPQLGLGSTLRDAGDPGQALYFLDKLNQIQADLGFARYTDAFVGDWDKANVFFVTLALMIGTAGLPHVIVRFYTVPTVRAARWSAFWALIFISLLYLTAPATAAFSRYYMIESLNGQTEETLPEWFTNWERTGLVQWFDDGDGKVLYSAGEDNEIFRNGSLGNAELASIRRDHERWLASDGAGGNDARIVMRARGLSGPDRDIIVLALPEMAELASWIIALVAAGGLAAALSTASGLLLVISSSVAHDVYYRMINPQADEQQRLLVGRGVIGLAVVVAGLFGVYPPGFVSQVVAFAFGLAAASFFPGHRPRHIQQAGRHAAGHYRHDRRDQLHRVLYYCERVRRYAAMDLRAVRQRHQSAGHRRFGALLNFCVTLLLTPWFPPPGDAAQEMVDQVREPEMDENAPRVPGL